jgi:hypothetical protein
MTYGCASLTFTEIKRSTITDTASITGKYTLILYGGGHKLETLALLDLEGDEYDFEPYAPAFNYRTTLHLTVDEALKEAGSFLGQKSIKISEITSKQGKILGYELKRRTWYLRYGTHDVLDVNYVLKENTLLIYIKLKPFVENILQGS